jgi:hypothetical protein
MSDIELATEMCVDLCDRYEELGALPRQVLDI